MRIGRLFAVFAVLALGAIALRPAFAYIEVPHSFGMVVGQSTNIVLMRVEAVDKEKNLIIYRKIRDVKGVHPTEVIKHNIGRNGLRPNEWKPTMEWAEPGKVAVFFYNGGGSETCIGNWWYQAYAGGEWWNHSHGEPFLLRSYCGPPEKLPALVTAVMEGKEVVVPCMVDGNKEDLHNRCGKIQRLKVSLKLQDYNQKRDFVGWGGEEFRRLLGMPGFTHITALARTDPDAQSISIVDFDNDGKPDLCMVGGGKLVIQQNNGETMSEIVLPGLNTARSAVWADYNGDGLPDLLVVASSGPKLYTNLGAGNLRDDSHLLPREAFYQLTAAAWADVDGDGKPDLILANGYHGLRVYQNTGLKMPPVKVIPKGAAFEDISAKVGLGLDGPATDVKFDSLIVRDVNGDGRPDFLYGNRLFLNQLTPAKTIAFHEVKDSGLNFQPHKVGAVFGDFDGDGIPDLFAPQKVGSKLYKGDGKGRFVDVTAKSGDLAGALGWATSAAWGDLDNDGHLDLIVGCLKGPNRFFRNRGNGTFEDATEKLGLNQRIFNTQAIACVDLNGDGQIDIVFNNEGQDSTILLGSGALGSTKRMPLTLRVQSKIGATGSQVRVLDKSGKQLASQEISGGDGRGSQQTPFVRFALEPGAYQVQVRLSNGTIRSREFTIGDSPVRGVVGDEATP